MFWNLKKNKSYDIIYDTFRCTSDATETDACSSFNCSLAKGCYVNEGQNATCFCDAGYKLELDNTCSGNLL